MSPPPPWSDDDRPDRDALDDVPEDGTRQGAHRSAGAAPLRVPRELLAMMLLGGLGLVLGAAAFVLSSMGVLGPGDSQEARAGSGATEGSDVSAAAPEESRDSEATAAPTSAPEGAEQVGIFNASLVDGVAGATSSQLTAEDWEVIATGNWGATAEQSVVYYAEDGVTGDTQEQAGIIAESLGIETVQADDAIAYPLVVVVGSDIAEDVLERSGGLPTAPAPTVPAPTSGQLPADQAAADPLTEEQTPVEQLPAEQLPAEQAPTGQLPADQLPLEQPPAGQLPTDPAGGV